MILYTNGPTIVVADEVNESGVVEIAMDNRTSMLAYAQLTMDQAVALAEHLDEIINDKIQKNEGNHWRDDKWRPHWCTEPLDEPCYWSGDPYASHGVGF